MSEKKKPVTAKLFHPRSAAVEAESELKKLKKKSRRNTIPPVEVKTVSDGHVPLKQEGVIRVFANVDANFQGSRIVALSHRNSVVLDLGFTAKVPDGFELVFDLLPELKERGLEVYKNTLRGKDKASIGVRNLGREIVQIRHQDPVAIARIVPVYELTLRVKNG